MQKMKFIPVYSWFKKAILILEHIAHKSVHKRQLSDKILILTEYMLICILNQIRNIRKGKS